MLTLVESRERECTKCAEVLPFRAFSRDNRSKTGVRGICKRCDRQATQLRRVNRAGRRFVVVPDREPSTAMAEAAELTIGALSPPAADADALLVAALRAIARLADLASDDGDVRAYVKCVGLLVRLLRELLATRASRRC